MHAIRKIRNWASKTENDVYPFKSALAEGWSTAHKRETLVHATGTKRPARTMHS